MVRFHAAVMTRYILAAACCVTLMAGDLTRLRQLEERHRMFELRDLLDAPGGNAAETLVYRAITNSRFGREREAVSQFHAFLATKPAPEMERKARYELSNALARLGQVGEAASELAAALRLTPEAVARFFEGLDLLEPGVVSCSRWRPEQTQVPDEAQDVAMYGGVGRKR